MRKLALELILIFTCASASGYIPMDQSANWKLSLNGQWRFMLNGPEATFF